MRLLWFNLATDADDPLLGFTTAWLRAVAERVEFIHVITMRAGRIDLPTNVRVHSVGKERGYSKPRRALEFYRYLFRILREDRVDACFSHMNPVFTVLAGPFLKFKRIPVVTWYAHRQVTMTLKLTHYLSDRIVSINEDSYRYRHDNKFACLGHGIDTSLFSLDSDVSENPAMLLSVGRLSPIKDLLTLVEAVQILRQRGYEAHCVLVGDVPQRDRSYAEAVRQRVGELGLEGAVQFVGPMPSDQVVHWYQQCIAHVNLCPTGAPDKAALEAMACGKPSFVANEGFRETLGQWVDLLLFRYGDSQDLARKIEHLFQVGEAGRQAIGVDLRQRVIERHGLERLTDRLVSFLEGLRMARWQTP